MDEASRGYVQMDELMEGVGKRLAELTGAEWGIVTAGCCAAITHCTAAAIAGFNPERMQRLPDLRGVKNEVVIPKYSRNVYDHAIRMLGAKVVTVSDPKDLESTFNDRTAMAYILGGPGDDGPLGTRVVAAGRQASQRPHFMVDAGGNSHVKAERPPGTGRDRRRLQRRQMHSRTSGRRIASRREKLAPVGMGQQRAASRLRPIAQSRQGRDHGHARGR